MKLGLFETFPNDMHACTAMSHCLWEMCWAPIWYFTSDKLAHRVHGSSGVFGTESLSLPCTPNRRSLALVLCCRQNGKSAQWCIVPPCQSDLQTRAVSPTTIVRVLIENVSNGDFQQQEHHER